MKIKEETCNLAIPVVNRATAHFHYVSPVANRFSSDFTDFFLLVSLRQWNFHEKKIFDFHPVFPDGRSPFYRVSPNENIIGQVMTFGPVTEFYRVFFSTVDSVFVGLD